MKKEDIDFLIKKSEESLEIEDNAWKKRRLSRRDPPPREQCGPQARILAFRIKNARIAPGDVKREFPEMSEQEIRFLKALGSVMSEIKKHLLAGKMHIRTSDIMNNYRFFKRNLEFIAEQYRGEGWKVEVEDKFLIKGLIFRHG